MSGLIRSTSAAALGATALLVSIPAAVASLAANPFVMAGAELLPTDEATIF